MSLLMKGLSMVIQCVRLLLFLVFINNVQAQRKTFNVKQYGAVADGKTDNSKVYISSCELKLKTMIDERIICIIFGRLSVMHGIKLVKTMEVVWSYFRKGYIW